MIIVIEQTWFSYLFGHRFSHSIIILNPAIFLIEIKFLFHIFYLALDTEVVVSQNGSQVSQVVQMPNLLCAVCPFFQLLRNLRRALCLFLQRLRNSRLRIDKFNICCGFIANFFPKCAITQ